MKDPPPISVVMPVCNGESTIERAITSILTQTGPDLELIVIDDGSGDRTGPIIAHLAEQDHRIRILTLPHGGIVGALNAGLNSARGRYIARMDTDDISLPRRLKLQSDYLDTHTACGLVSCLVDIPPARQDNRGYRHYVTWTNSLLTHEEIVVNRFVESPISHPSVMFRRECVDQFGGYREGDFPEDYELWLRWLEAGVRFEKLPETLLLWTDYPHRLSRRNNRYSSDAFYHCKAPYLARWLKANVDRPVYVWGAGKTTRKRVRMLEQESVSLTGYIDVDPKKIGHDRLDLPVLDYRNIPGPDDAFVLVYMATRGMRDRIGEYLTQQGFAEGAGFLCCA
ncbi:MAG: glycosyltransferase [Chitinivibrionales bacterium]|nr:glycosyltransferase [Chitinivibrionales bacterium]